MQPLQRSYAINEERIEAMISKGSLSSLYDESKVYELENKEEALTDKEQKKLDAYNANKDVYEDVLGILRAVTGKTAVFYSQRQNSFDVDYNASGRMRTDSQRKYAA